MKINSKNLWDFINELSRNEKVKFKVYCDDSYVTNILWDGENFEWESGTFTSEAFFNPLYDFEVIEEDKKIEKLELYEDSDGHYFYDKHCKKIYITCDEINFMFEQFNELIDEVNKLKVRSE